MFQTDNTVGVLRRVRARHAAGLALGIVILSVFGALASGGSAISAIVEPESTITVQQSSSWWSDPNWYNGKAEWALYDATRNFYGRARHYEATIFTNKQQMDPDTTTKAENDGDGNAFEVFKHNVSEIIPTENYDYRFLTTAFVRVDDLLTYKLIMSSQDDCGASYKQFVVDDNKIHATSFSYFPNEGVKDETYRLPGQPRNFCFHDDLTLTLRGYPFDQADPSGDPPGIKRKLIGDQTVPVATSQQPQEALIEFIAIETLDVPYGSVETFHLRVTHEPIGSTDESHYWFATDPAMRHVLVQYQGPWGITYRLKRLEWWAYWSDPRPE